VLLREDVLDVKAHEGNYSERKVAIIATVRSAVSDEVAQSPVHEAF